MNVILKKKTLELSTYNTYWPPQFTLKTQIHMTLQNDTLLCNWRSSTKFLALYGCYGIEVAVTSKQAEQIKKKTNLVYYV